MLEKPAVVLGEPGHALEHLVGERRGRRDGQHTHKRLHLQRDTGATIEQQEVIVEAIVVVPKTTLVEGRSNVREVFEELRRHVLVCGVLFGEDDRDLQHVEAVQRHPRRAIRLLQPSRNGQRRRTVDWPDVVEPQKAAFEDVVAVVVLAVHPPCEVQRQFLENALEKEEIFRSVDLEDAQRGPRVHGRIDVAQ